MKETTRVRENRVICVISIPNIRFASWNCPVIGSEEEREDLKKAYIDNKGDMNRILEYVLFSNPTDEPRLCEIIDKWIEDEEVPAFDKYVKEPESKKLKRKLKVSNSFIIFPWKFLY